MTAECGKCSGTGILRAFMHIDNGRCFTCSGAGTIELRANTSKPRAPKDMARDDWRKYYGDIIRVGQAHAAQVDRHVRADLTEAWRGQIAADLAEGHGHLHCLVKGLVPADLDARIRVAFAKLGVIVPKSA